jgi:hypothetical protein
VTDAGDVLFGRAEMERAFTTLGERLARRVSSRTTSRCRTGG